MYKTNNLLNILPRQFVLNMSKERILEEVNSTFKRKLTAPILFLLDDNKLIMYSSRKALQFIN